jgi:hypothetical protein
MKIYILFIFVWATKVLPFTNHVSEFVFPIMVIEMLFNNKVQIFSFWNEFTMRIYNCVHYCRNFINFQFFHLNKLSIRYELSNLRFCVTFK